MTDVCWGCRELQLLRSADLDEWAGFPPTPMHFGGIAHDITTRHDVAMSPAHVCARGCICVSGCSSYVAMAAESCLVT